MSMTVSNFAQGRPVTARPPGSSALVQAARLQSKSLLVGKFYVDALSSTTVYECDRRDVRPEMTTKKTSKAVQLRRERKRLEILSAAAATFNSKGYHNTTIDDLCDILKLSKPTVYYYVKDKEALLFECSRIATTELHAAIRKARDEGRNGLQRLRNIFVAYAEIMSTDFGKCLILTSRSDMSTESSERLWEGRRRLNNEVREVIEQGIADGSIRPCNPKFLSYALFGSFNWIAYWYDETGEQTPTEVAEEFLKIYHSGIAAVSNGAGGADPQTN